MFVPRVAIVLVNWNGRDDTIACLESLLQLNTSHVAIIVCDNDSKDGSVEALLEWSSKYPATESARLRIGSMPPGLKDYLTIVPTGGNIGFAAANNVGIRLALETPSIEHVWILNNDTEVEPESLSALQKRMLDNPRIGICGSTLIYFDNRRCVQAVGVRYDLATGRGWQIGWGKRPTELPAQANVEKTMSYVPGASMLVSRAFIETVGEMSEDYFLYFEEMDWSLRNRGRFLLGWAPNSIVYHKEGGSIGTSTNKRASNLAIYYQNRNLLKIISKFCPVLIPLTLLRLVVVSMRFLLHGDLDGAKVVCRAFRDFISGYNPPRPKTRNEAA